MSINSYNKTN